MQEELLKENQINSAVEDVRLALLEDFKVKQKTEELAREKTKTHYNLVKVQQRLWSLQQELNY